MLAYKAASSVQCLALLWFLFLVEVQLLTGSPKWFGGSTGSTELPAPIENYAKTTTV